MSKPGEAAALAWSLTVPSNQALNWSHMRIYIDEAGPFVVPPSAQSLFSLVLAIVVPSCIEGALIAEFSALRDGWSHPGGELKGSKLDESQAAQLIELASRYDVFVIFFAVDMAMHDDAVVSEYKSRQADAVTAGLTLEHNPQISAQLQGLADAIRRMPNQLFLQAFLMIDLVLKVIEDSTLYYVQRVPAELGSIAWVIDRKNRTITEMEDTWSTLVLPMSESHFAKTPLPCLLGADYSHFDAHYKINANDQEAIRHVKWMREAYGIQDVDRPLGLNSTLLLSEQREFADSSGSLGLQLADMLAAILRRALNDRLQAPGWKNFGRLLIADRRTPFVQFGEPDGRSKRMHGQVEKVWPTLKTGTKEMLVRR